MIISFVFICIASFFSVIIWPVKKLSEIMFTNDMVVPLSSRIPDMMDWLFSPLLYFNGIFNIPELFIAAGILLTLLTYIYGIRLAFWAYSQLPFSRNARAPFSRDEAKKFTIT